MRAARTLAFLLAALPLLSGCLGTTEYRAFDPDEHYRNRGVFEGKYRLGNAGSMPLQGGPHWPLPVEVIRLVSERPAYDGAVGSPPDPSLDPTVHIPMAIWRPANTTGPVPIVVDAGPYYEVFQHCMVPGQTPCTSGLANDTIDYPGQSTPFLLQNILPHGYAVVQLAVRGTGTAGGCMDLFGDDERADLDQAIRWLGDQPWSNGRIAMMGVSYDGSTPWVVAGTGNPYLKTIVPISGLPDLHDLMFRNGSAESRGAIMHSTSVYWSYGFSEGFLGVPGGLPLPVPVPAPLPVDPANPLRGTANGRTTNQDLHNLLCRDAIVGQGMGQATVATGDRHEDVEAYWAERDHRDDVLANYDGSVFLVHGLQDWNVDPHVAVPFNQALRAKGLEVKEWYGQWDHTTPDGMCANGLPDWLSAPCRLDYADVLLRWFERHLKGNLTVDVGPAVQVQDSVGFWRNAEAFPPSDPDWLELRLDAGNEALARDASGETRVDLMPPVNGAPARIVELRSEPLADDLRISGLPQLRVPFQVQGATGELAAWLLDEDPSGNVRSAWANPPLPGSSDWTVDEDCQPADDWFCPVVGHAQMNLRYHAGGNEAQVLQPGTRYVARMEFEPLEVLIPRGHRLTLWLFQATYMPEHQSNTASGPVSVFLGADAVLRLPTIEDDPRDLFPVPLVHFPSRDLLEPWYVPKPVFSSGTGEALQTVPTGPTQGTAPSGRAAATGPAGPLALPSGVR